MSRLCAFLSGVVAELLQVVSDKPPMEERDIQYIKRERQVFSYSRKCLRASVHCILG